MKTGEGSRPIIEKLHRVTPNDRVDTPRLERQLATVHLPELDVIQSGRSGRFGGDVQHLGRRIDGDYPPGGAHPLSGQYGRVTGTGADIQDLAFGSDPSRVQHSVCDRREKPCPLCSTTPPGCRGLGGAKEVQPHAGQPSNRQPGFAHTGDIRTNPAASG